MKKITENNYMTVFSDLELSACIQTEHKSQDLQISRIDVQPKTLPEGQTTGTIRLVFSFPATDISGRWYPICKFGRLGYSCGIHDCKLCACRLLLPRRWQKPPYNRALRSPAESISEVRNP